MIILRRLFSKSDKEEGSDNKKDKIKSALAISSGGAAILGADKLSTRIIQRHNKKLEESNNKINAIKGNEKINERLKQKAKDWKVNILEGNDFGYDSSSDSMMLDKSNRYRKNPAALSHELGHAAMSKRGRSKDIIGKAAHLKIADGGRGLAMLSNGAEIEGKERLSKGLKHATNATFFLLGAEKGKSAAEKEESGDKKGARKSISRGVIESALVTAPMLIQEGAASRKGLKLLKESGASKELIKESKRNMKHAFGTYAGLATKPTLITAGGTGIGYGVEKLRPKKNKNKDKDDNTKK